MKRILALICIVLFAAFPLSAQSPTLETVCRWGVFSSGRLFSWADWHHVEFTDAALLASLRSLDASDKFDYDAGGFTPTFELTLTSVSGAHRVDVWTRADDSQYVYLFAYRSLVPFARADGSRFGAHGCSGNDRNYGGAFRLPMTEWTMLLSEMEQA